MDCLRMIVEGRVQGVGFRAFVVREARALGIGGAVWNRADGAVELEAEGDRQVLERFAAIVGRGNSGSRVRTAQMEWSTGRPRHNGFGVRGGRS